jgi:hypothetical protein
MEHTEEGIDALMQIECSYDRRRGEVHYEETEEVEEEEEEEEDDDDATAAADRIFMQLHAISTSLRENVFAKFLTELQSEVSKKVSEEGEGGEFLDIFGRKLDGLFGYRMPTFRIIPEPSPSAINRSDILVIDQCEVLSDVSSPSSSSLALPIFVTFTDKPQQVIPVVLSVYVRKGRLPEPGEVLFCNERTRMEDIELILLRFFMAKQRGREKLIFTIADVHVLK